MAIKAVFFDMDGTLVHVPISPVQFLRKVYQKLGLDFSLEQIAIAYEKQQRWWNGSPFSDYTLRTREAFIKSNRKTPEFLGAKGDLQKLSENVQSYWENLPEEADEKLYPEVRSVLRTLREKGITLGILSNRLSSLSLRSLEKHKISGYFQCVICPQNAGAPKGKNSPQMWQYALNTVGAEPKEILHVDNDYETGIVGAKKAGMRPVLIDRKGIYSYITDCPVIRDLTEIFELLSSASKLE